MILKFFVWRHTKGKCVEVVRAAEELLSSGQPLTLHSVQETFSTFAPQVWHLQGEEPAAPYDLAVDVRRWLMKCVEDANNVETQGDEVGEPDADEEEVDQPNADQRKEGTEARAAQMSGGCTVLTTIRGLAAHLLQSDAQIERYVMEVAPENQETRYEILPELLENMRKHVRSTLVSFAPRRLPM